MTDDRKAAILAILAATPIFSWLIFPELGLADLIKLGVAVMFGAVVALAIPSKEDKQDGEG